MDNQPLESGPVSVQGNASSIAEGGVKQVQESSCHVAVAAPVEEQNLTQLTEAQTQEIDFPTWLAAELDSLELRYHLELPPRPEIFRSTKPAKR